MEFDSVKCIYLQIVDQSRELIFTGEWPVGEKIPSVREMAVNMGVNPNTVLRSYQTLVSDGIIENHRGFGYIVRRGALQVIEEMMKKQFIEKELPRVFFTMEKLGFGIMDIVSHYENKEKEKEKEKENEN